MLYSLEDETRKLHQVITQLRSVRRTQNSEEQSAQQELTHIKQLYTTLQDEYRQQQQLVQLQTQQLTDLQHLQEIYQQLTMDYKQVDQTLQDMKIYTMNKEKQLYDQIVQFDHLQSEYKLSKQEAHLLQQELSNLKDGISVLESDYKHKLYIAKQQYLELQDKQQAIIQEEIQNYEMKHQIMIQQWKEKWQDLQLMYDDALLVNRQQHVIYEQEKIKLQASLQQVITQFQNSTQDVIDRTLMSNLILSYFQRNKSREVLQLIAKVLALNDEQMIIVGLKPKPLNLFSSLFNTVLGAAEPVPVEVSEISIEDIYIETSANEMLCLL
jgi:hypothetical protein